EILATALELVDADNFDDLEPAPSSGHRAVTTVRPGGQVLRVKADDAASQRAALLSALDWACHAGVRRGDTAILVPDNRRAQEWARTLASAGVSAQLLTDYEGATSDAVKIGTYQRAKGLEFACVFVPDYHLAIPQQGPSEPDEAYRERAALARRRLFVAMTRARDRLWLGTR
ncbi:MAG TPA: 3'-5' exonuclease, partial [Actinomycetales bacterium]|nr:3'-5' exonuclease [Actinomycetales bacterium]